MKCKGLIKVGSSDFRTDSINTGRNVFVVSDNYLGASQKNEASKICTKTIEKLNYTLFDMESREYIKMCIENANENMITKAKKDGYVSYTTMSMALVEGGYVYSGTIGDSPVYHISTDGIERLSIPGKTYKPLVTMGIINEEETLRKLKQLPQELLYAYNTYLPMVLPVISFDEKKVAAGDKILICTDGVSNLISEYELYELVNDESVEIGIKNIFDLLEKRSAGKKYIDDGSVVLVEV